ncbi:uncharacterized protein LOC142336588 [Convolutriloba macropyga]|uniref:uncharacterized protein LOC142336588 n=1 Tax=Convolutriloba macropyga TaxID=536237 RepID=UPI003F524366
MWMDLIWLLLHFSVTCMRLYAELTISHDVGCIDGGMKRDTHPRCIEGGGQERDIQSNISGNCQINWKRTDGIWGPWDENVEIDTGDTYKSVRSRVCFGTFHGGIDKCSDIASKQSEISLWIVREKTRKVQELNILFILVQNL